MSRFIIALVLTCCLTCIAEFVPLLFLKNRWSFVRTSILCNIVTNPVLNVVVAMVLVYTNDYTAYYIVLAFLEIAVVFVEGLYYKRFVGIEYKKAVLVSLIANVCSYVAGTIVNETGLIFKLLPLQ